MSKQFRVFVNNPDGEPMGYLGDEEDILKFWQKGKSTMADEPFGAMFQCLVTEIEECCRNGGGDFEIHFHVKEMTDEEVEALPEV